MRQEYHMTFGQFNLKWWAYDYDYVGLMMPFFFHNAASKVIKYCIIEEKDGFVQMAACRRRNFQFFPDSDFVLLISSICLFIYLKSYFPKGAKSLDSKWR